MKYKLYTNSETAWDAMREAILEAKESVYWESYIFFDDVVTHRFLDLLKEKSRSGVSVKIVLDSVGSFKFFGNLSEAMGKSGIELLYFNRLLPWWNPNRFRRWWFLRTHRKLLVIDGKVGFIGGVNVGSRYKKWLDLHLRIEDGVVRQFAKSFARSYRLCGGKGRILIPPKKPTPLNVLFLEHWPLPRKSILKRFYIEKCAIAQKSIVIATPYFVPHRWLTRALRAAISRGVKVSVILPRETDVWILDAANKVFREIGYHMGIEFYLVPEMIHAKALLVDDREGLIGTNNIDSYSFDYNVEAAVVFKERAMVGDLKAILEGWKRLSTLYCGMNEDRKWHQRLIYAVIKFLQPIL